jgi:hypothetical protein
VSSLLSSELIMDDIGNTLRRLGTDPRTLGPGVLYALPRLRVRSRRPRCCFDGIRRASILADQHTPSVLRTGTATYTTTASPRRPRRTLATLAGELPRVYQAKALGATNFMARATLAVGGGAEGFIGHHLAAASAKKRLARGHPGEPSIPPSACAQSVGW